MAEKDEVAEITEQCDILIPAIEAAIDDEEKGVKEYMKDAANLRKLGLYLEADVVEGIANQEAQHKLKLVSTLAALKEMCD